MKKERKQKYITAIFMVLGIVGLIAMSGCVGSDKISVNGSVSKVFSGLPAETDHYEVAVVITNKENRSLAIDFLRGYFIGGNSTFMTNGTSENEDNSIGPVTNKTFRFTTTGATAELERKALEKGSRILFAFEIVGNGTKTGLYVAGIPSMANLTAGTNPLLFTKIQ